MAVYCGVDWAEGHHDIALIDDEGKLLAKRRILENVDGLAELTAMLAAAGDTAEQPIPVAIETPRGLLVAALRATGRPTYPINPLAVARYRERTTVSGKKSDHVDAMALANILRTDAHLHRLLPDDSPLARAITVLARAYQDGVWRRTKLVQELRARLCEYYPGFLQAFAAGSGSGRGLSTTQLASGDARAVLAIAPSPADGLKITRGRVEAALRRGGRQRRITTLAGDVVTALRAPQLRQDPSWSRRCAPRPSPCSASWTRSAHRWSSLPAASPRRSPSTPTTRSLPASPGWPTSAARSCSPRSATTGTGSPTIVPCRPSRARHR